MSTLFMMSVGICISVLAGLLAGGLANWMSDHLPHWETRRMLPNIRASEIPHYWTLWWYWRRQDCPHCRVRRPLRAPLLEVGSAVVFAITYVLSPQEPLRLGAISLYALLLLTILVIDLEHRRVLNVMLAPAVGIVLPLNLLPGMPGIADALLGSLVGFGLLLILALIGRGKLGAGDVKLGGLLGLMTGYPAIWSALTIGMILGGVSAAMLMVSRRASRKSMMAYAPYLAIGALVTLWQNIY